MIKLTYDNLALESQLLLNLFLKTFLFSKFHNFLWSSSDWYSTKDSWYKSLVMTWLTTTHTMNGYVTSPTIVTLTQNDNTVCVECTESMRWNYIQWNSMEWKHWINRVAIIYLNSQRINSSIISNRISKLILVTSILI